MYENCKVHNPRGKRTAVKMGEVVWPVENWWEGKKSSVKEKMEVCVRQLQYEKEKVRTPKFRAN